MKSRFTKGFTLIEILIVIALIAILAAITIIAINPAKHFRDARNTQRRSDVLEILNAVTEYTSEQGHNLSDFGVIPLCTGTPAHIGTGVGNINLGTLLVSDYIAAIATDPSGGTAADTNYTICTTAASRVQVAAPNAESTTITVLR